MSPATVCKLFLSTESVERLSLLTATEVAQLFLWERTLMLLQFLANAEASSQSSPASFQSFVLLLLTDAVAYISGYRGTFLSPFPLWNAKLWLQKFIHNVMGYPNVREHSKVILKQLETEGTIFPLIVDAEDVLPKMTPGKVVVQLCPRSEQCGAQVAGKMLTFV
jgi:hypothetical protein